MKGTRGTLHNCGVSTRRRKQSIQQSTYIVSEQLASFQTHSIPFRVPSGTERFLMRRACFAAIQHGWNKNIDVNIFWLILYKQCSGAKPASSIQFNSINIAIYSPWLRISLADKIANKKQSPPDTRGLGRKSRCWKYLVTAVKFRLGYVKVSRNYKNSKTTKRVQ